MPRACLSVWCLAPIPITILGLTYADVNRSLHESILMDRDVFFFLDTASDSIDGHGIIFGCNLETRMGVNLLGANPSLSQVMFAVYVYKYIYCLRSWRCCSIKQTNPTASSSSSSPESTTWSPQTSSSRPCSQVQRLLAASSYARTTQCVEPRTCPQDLVLISSQRSVPQMMLARAPAAAFKFNVKA